MPGESPVSGAPDGPGLGIRHFQSAMVEMSQHWHRERPWTIADWVVATVGEPGEARTVMKKTQAVERWHRREFGKRR